MEAGEGSGWRPGTGFLAQRTGSLSHIHIGMDGMLRWLSKQVNWAGLPRDQDRWIEGLNERGEAERVKEWQMESGGALRVWKKRVGWRETDMASDHRHHGEHAA